MRRVPSRRRGRGWSARLRLSIGDRRPVRGSHPVAVSPTSRLGGRFSRQTRHLPPLMAAAIAWDAWLSLLPESRSGWRATLLAALTLKIRGLTPHLLLPIDIGWRFSRYRRHANHDLATRIAGFLGWVQAAAIHGQKEFDSLALAGDMLRSGLRGSAIEFPPAGADRTAPGAAVRLRCACGESARRVAPGRARHADASSARPSTSSRSAGAIKSGRSWAGRDSRAPITHRCLSRRSLARASQPVRVPRLRIADMVPLLPGQGIRVEPCGFLYRAWV